MCLRYSEAALRSLEREFQSPFLWRNRHGWRCSRWRAGRSPSVSLGHRNPMGEISARGTGGSTALIQVLIHTLANEGVPCYQGARGVFGCGPWSVEPERNPEGPRGRFCKELLCSLRSTGRFAGREVASPLRAERSRGVPVRRAAPSSLTPCHR